MKLENLEEIALTECRGVQGTGFAHLNNLSRLELLSFVTWPGVQNNFSDQGLLSISTLPHLKTLRLVGSPAVTDAGLAHLSRMKELEYVYIYNSAITDRGLEHLVNNSRLKAFAFPGSAVTSEGEAKLRAAIGKGMNRGQ